jgi:hypothetical protein
VLSQQAESERERPHTGYGTRVYCATRIQRLQQRFFTMLMNVGYCWNKAFIQLSIRRCYRSCATRLDYLRVVPSSNACCHQKHSYFSTQGANESDGQTLENEPGKLLYRRSENRLNVPRYFLAFSTCQMGYWIWYVTEFTAAIASKGVFEVNYYLGGIGLGMSVILMVGSCAYPRHLISEIRDLGKGELMIKNHTIPFASADKVGSNYPAGSLKIENVDKEHIIKKGSIANYGNHLAITNVNSRFPFLLSPKADDVLKEAELVSLLIPGSLSAREKRELNGDRKQVTKQRKRYVHVMKIPRSSRQLPRIRP